GGLDRHDPLRRLVHLHLGAAVVHGDGVVAARRHRGAALGRRGLGGSRRGRLGLAEVTGSGTGGATGQQQGCSSQYRAGEGTGQATGHSASPARRDISCAGPSGQIRPVVPGTNRFQGVRAVSLPARAGSGCGQFWDISVEIVVSFTWSSAVVTVMVPAKLTSPGNHTTHQPSEMLASAKLPFSVDSEMPVTSSPAEPKA